MLAGEYSILPLSGHPCDEYIISPSTCQAHGVDFLADGQVLCAIGSCPSSVVGDDVDTSGVLQYNRHQPEMGSNDG
jgi:hypothetical protein